VNLNNDNYTDFIISGRYGNANDEFQTSVYLNIDGTGFNNTQNLTGIKFGHISSGDIDNDNDSDIILIGCNTGSASTASCTSRISRVYINNAGILSFSSSWSNNLTSVWKGSLTLGDYDNNGLLDLLLAGTNNTDWTESIIKLYLNNGTSFIEDPFNVFQGLFSGSLAFADYNNDNNLDIFYTGANETQHANTRIYRSDASYVKNNTPPSPPTKVNITYTNNRMHINWSAGSDAESPVLYYNLKVGSNTTNQNILSGLNPMSANPPQGHFGNMQLLQDIYLNIPERCSYAEVQAIDTSYVKSSWSVQVNYSSNETCDSYDNDCDQLIDEDWDLDGDGQVGAAYQSVCTGITIFDCNDADANVMTGDACGYLLSGT
jgi:hypothetical protein